MLLLKLAWRNLFRNTRRTILSVMLISFSLTALILTDGLILGVAELLIGGITQTLAGEAQIHKKGFLDNFDVDLYLENPSAIYRTLKADSSVKGYAPRVMVGGMIASTYNTSGGLIYGVDADSETKVSKIKQAVIKGEYLSGSNREVLIGKPMADILEVDLGDRIVITGSEVNTGDIAQELFRVTGIFEFGPSELDKNIVFINLKSAQKLIAIKGGVHQIVVQFHEQADAKNRQLPLFMALNTADVEALGWLDFNPQIGALLEMSNYSTLIVGIILFLLASLGVINSMFMSIYERIYEIGVIKAIGSKPRDIVRLVLCEAFMLALISCVLGCLLGFILGTYFAEYGVPMGEKMEMSGVVINEIYIKLEPSQFINYPFYVILLTLVAAIYPSRFASRITPSEALQRVL